MANIHNDRYDEIKSLIKKSRILLEQDTQDNVAASVQKRINQDQEYETAVSDRESSNREPGDDIEDNETSSSSPQDKTQKYRISGGILALHGKNKNNLDITTDEKTAFQETMDEFVDEVSDLVDFNTLNVYPNNVDWSGKVIDQDIEFTFTIGEDSGIYINGDMIKVDADFLEMLNNLQQFYQKFKSKWGKVLASRKKTKESPE
jgi:hypothetical protein